MIKELKNLFVIALVFGSYNFFVFSQETLTFNTVTEALNYNGNKSTVTKLIITGTISGNDYSTSSEWSKFRTFNETFPNIEEMEILTDQNIPDYIATRGLFNNVNWLKKFSAPNVTNIGNRAFERCNNLILINFPLVTTIGSSAFYSCKNLTSVNFPLATNIGNSAFESCDNNLTSVNFPLVTNIEKDAFYYCLKLASINFPLATTIGERAFSYCENLTSANFPLVTNISVGAFGGCSFTSTDSAYFPLATTIEGGAFGICKNLISVEFPLVTTIGESAFNSCENLTSANFPLVTNIGERAFESCYYLTSVNLNFPLVTTIGGRSFESCLSLTSVNFPLVTTIGWQAFYRCKNLTSINFPLVTTIGNYAFGLCASLTSINFPLATTIGNYAFSNCLNLVSATFGTGFETKTEIKFGELVFTYSETQDVDLILGGNVLPIPDLDKKTWQNANTTGSGENHPYYWKSIKVETESIDEAIKNSTVNIYPNPTNSETTVSFELESACNMKILLCDVLGIELINVYDGFASEGLFSKTIDTEHLPQGVYFIKIHINGNTITKKIIK